MATFEVANDISRNTPKMTAIFLFGELFVSKGRFNCVELAEGLNGQHEHNGLFGDVFLTSMRSDVILKHFSGKN